MGKVRTEQVKRVARELLEKYPSKFSANFEANKKLVNDYTNISSIKLRNRVAGYVSRLAAASSGYDIDEEDEEQ
ncbi:MAG: 30S ribosomal protein S17e [Candidatus Bathyarchaeota archaeon]|nr:30S ribosomal protein S17e [Candidatus Bathyarchaeota archaeon]